MKKFKTVALNFIFFLQVLLVFLLFVEDYIELPRWLQVVGRLHPAVLHLPIGLFVFLIILILARNEFRKKTFRKITVLVLWLTAFTASVTALAGFFLSRQGDYGPDNLTLHKIGGIILSFSCYALVLLFDRPLKPAKRTFNWAVLATFGVLLFAGHTGGTLTHGENFVFAPLKNTPDAIPEDATVFQAFVYPILEKKCISCHNQSKAKGKLVMTSLDKFQKGGKKGKEWVEGSPAESRMIKYIHLPLEDDDHMPPDGKPQLSNMEIKVLEQWIRSGADVISMLADMKESDSLKLLAAELNGRKGAEPEKRNYEFQAVDENVIDKLNTPFRSVFPLYRDCPAVQADFFVKQYFETKALEELSQVKEQLVILNLSKMPLTDGDMSVLRQFKNLEKINLNFSNLSGPGLSSLQDLKKLNSISLAGTGVEAISLAPLLSLPALKELFIWNTKVTTEEKEKMVKAYPRIKISTSQFMDDRILGLSRPVLTNEGILKRNEKVTLKHAMPGVEIRYTLDGTDPDSLTAKKYDGPFILTSSAKIKAIACKPGWYCSGVLETTCFLEGRKPRQAALLTPPDKEYPGEGSKSLTDGRKGFTDVFRDPSWLGYRDQPFTAGFDMGKDSPVGTMVISYGKSLYSSIFPPQSVEVWGGSSTSDLKLLNSVKVEQPGSYEPQAKLEALIIPLENGGYSFYKVVAKPIAKLPPWHSSKGKKGWVFVDEVFFY